MAQINQMLTLVKYDYRYLYYFNKQMTSFKEQLVHKYNKNNNYQIYLISIEKNNKRKRKKWYYEKLYIKNKYLYYAIFTEKVFSKYIRKQLFKDLLTLSKSLIMNLILEYFGIKKKLKKCLTNY